MEGRRWFVFVSHGGQDTWIARQIARGISAAGADVFLDEADIRTGDDFAAIIRPALERADELLVLWTPWSLDRPFVWMEVGTAWYRQIRTVQVLYGVTTSDLLTRPSFPAPLKTLDMLNINAIDGYFAELRRRTRGDTDDRDD